jgi:hypothetical protein
MIRSYRDTDYEKLKELYQHPEWYGGIFDEARDSRERLAKKIEDDSEAIMVYEQDDELLGTISLIEDGRVAWFYRFIAKDFEPQITRELYDAAIAVLKSRGHTQVLVYSAVDDAGLDARYQSLGMNKGSNYSCFWQEI